MEKTIKFEVTMEEFNTLMAALGELPLKVSGQLAGKLHQLATEQLQTQKLPNG